MILVVRAEFQSPFDEGFIFVSHLPDLDEIDKSSIEEIFARTYLKIKRVVKQDAKLKVAFRQSQKDGLRRKTMVHIRFFGAGFSINASSEDWKVLLAAKEAARTLEAEARSRFRK